MTKLFLEQLPEEMQEQVKGMLGISEEEEGQDPDVGTEAKTKTKRGTGDQKKRPTWEDCGRLLLITTGLWILIFVIMFLGSYLVYGG